MRARTAVVSLGVAWAAFRVGKSIVDAGIQLEQMRNRMLAATGDARVAANALGYVRDEAERLGLDVRTASDGFAGFAASALRAGLTLQQTKDIFSGVSEAAVAMRLPVEQTSLVFKALEQMAGKGVVSMEELRGQLGDALPGAFEIAAKAMGKTTAEFSKMVANGQVMSADFLPKFGDAVRRELGGSVEEASQSAQAAFNRLGNALLELQAKLAESGILDVVVQGVNDLTRALNDPAMVDGLQKFARALAEIARIAIQVASGIGAALYKIGEFETKALAVFGLGAGAKGNKTAPQIRIPAQPQTPAVAQNYTLGTRSVGVASSTQQTSRDKAAKQADAMREQLSSQVSSLRYSLSSPTDRAAIDIENQQKLLKEALEKKAITEQEYRDLSLEAEMAYQDKLKELRTEARDEELGALESFLDIRLKTQEDMRNMSLQEQAQGFRQTISQAAQHNRAFFALEKAAAIARALLQARESVVNAYNFGSRLGGPVLGAAFAGIAAAAQAANIAAIASTSYSGGGASVSDSGGSTATSASSGSGGGATTAEPTKVMQITLVGSEVASWSKNQIRDLIELINDAQRDGSRVQVVNA